MAEGLNAPGSATARPRRRTRRLSLLPILLSVVGAALLFVAGWILLVDDPLGGQPVAVVTLERPSAQRTDSGEDLGIRPTVDTAEAAPLPGGHAEPPADLVISDPLAIPGSARAAAVLPRLAAESPHGVLPVVGPDGRRPADVFAHAPAAVPPGAPRIAILVGGMGLSTRATEAAIDRLPSEVTLAFAPYGDEIGRLTARARQSGHELALQVPLEPYDYPDNDPGPHTLLTGLSEDQNRDRLHWVMTRFGGYVGVLNYMGARFTASDPSLRPILGELRDRGLIYLDDGSSQRSVAGRLADEIGLPFARADLVIDAVPDRAAIDAGLARLAMLAREKGLAVGVASALPVTIDAVAEWAATLETQGIVLVPATAAVAGGHT